MARFRAALVQFTAARETAPNIATLREIVRAAHAGGAALVLTPENSGMLEPDDAAKLAKATHEVLAAAGELARETAVWLHLGSIAIAHADGRRIHNRSYLLRPDGTIAARYDKVHLFDVDLDDARYRESASVAPGTEAVVADLPWARLGLSICYDVRFPHFYRALAHAGAEVIMVPSAFTVPTGRAHWEVLLRARAIETGCYVLAAAQTGTHAGDRRTWGHSLAIDPWGAVIADGGSEPTTLQIDIDTAAVAAARRALPSLAHDRPFAPPVPTVGADAAE